MDIRIRSERISDYNGIANVNYEAFLGWHPDNPYVSEPILVDLLRHNSMFDPDLSLVAELDGKVAGHVLFSPFKFIVLGKEQLGAVLAPVAVKPEFQRKGIGRMLIEEGHIRVKQKGITFSLLCGHVEYYPKFGYKTGMFSLAGAKANIAMEGFRHEGFTDRPVGGQDIPWMLEMWRSRHGADTLALFPGLGISDWSNHGPGCRCSVVIKDGRILGFARYVGADANDIKELLAKSEDTPDVLAYLLWKNFGRARGEVRTALPAEKLQASLGNAGCFEISDERTAHEAFMIRVLERESPMASYCEKVEKGLLKPGIIVFPPMFDVDDGRE